MKRILTLIVAILCAHWSLAQNPADPQLIKGVVTTEDLTTLPGATIKLKGGDISTSTDNKGTFKMYVPSKETTLQISFVGYESQEIKVQFPFPASIAVTMKLDKNQLKEVQISTGYQTIAKERATGSFSKLDNARLDMKVSTDIISRLKDEVPGLVFNTVGTGANGNNSISIRGQSTIYSNTQPLIVIDNFPYDGDLNDINPNDVESISILKDAAAASIWGSRAGNGVIVITTKKGGYNREAHVSFNANLTIGNKPNLFYQPQMSSADFIGIEELLYGQGFYASAIQSQNNLPLTPVVNLLSEQSNGQVSPGDAAVQINAFKNQDVRNDFERYFYRKSINQQYAISVSGGSDIQQYFISAGYDKNLDNLVNNGYERYTLNANNTYSLFNKKLELSSSIYFTQSNIRLNNPGYGGITESPTIPLYPYAQFADSHGNPLPTVKDYNTSFIETAQNQGLLNWQYDPIKELNLANNKAVTNDYKINAGLRYKIINGLNAQLLYQYESSITGGRKLQSQDTYYTRNLINNFTVLNPDNTLSYNIPLGGILDINHQAYTSQNLRAQLNYEKAWNNKNEVSAIAGYEIQDQHTSGNIYRLYGYDDAHAISGIVPYGDFFPQYSYPGNYAQIPNIDAESDLTDRYRSYYANAAYTYDKRFILSGSARIDQSNLFGVKTNQKEVPLWSAGLAWNINNESFYNIAWLPYLKLRATYGYNGNINKTLSAYTTANYESGSSSSTGLNYAQIANPPNPDLRWERVQIINFGLDFQTAKNLLSGTLEFYRKKGLDLIGQTPFPPSTGITDFTGNDADTKGNGVELNLTTRNIDRDFKWISNFLFSFNTDKVTQYAEQANVSEYLSSLGGFPLVGKPLYAVYSYKWAGLDPQNGNPRGYLNGAASEDYSSIIANATPGNIVYNGPARPPVFGSLRNTLSYKGVSLSANISYRFGYYFRRNSINYTNVLNGLGGSGDFDLRWQRPGDENITNVPSIPSTADSNRDSFYLYSSALVGKADNIRLQEINISYSLTKAQIPRLPFSSVKVYGYCNNVGILWKAVKGSLDPDYATAVYPPVRTYSLGIKADF